MNPFFVLFYKGLRRINTGVYQFYKRCYYGMLHENILVDKQTFFGKKAEIKALKNSIVDIRGVAIKDYAQIYADANAEIRIGRGAEIGRFTMIVAKEKIIIGANTLIAEFVTIRDQDHVIGDLKKFVTAPIVIGDEVWLANKVTITKGLTIGDGAVIGANSVVTKSIEAGTIAVGAPARIIKQIIAQPGI